jgi:hypothetical protein
MKTTPQQAAPNALESNVYELVFVPGLGLGGLASVVDSIFKKAKTDQQSIFQSIRR